MSERARISLRTRFSGDRAVWGCAVFLPAVIGVAGAFYCPAIGAAEPSAEEKRIDAAIVSALQFLSREQMPSGAWRIDAYGDSTAATSLAVMAFLAAGHVPGEGPYGQQIERGISWVIDHQAENGMIVHQKSHGPLYSHGISTLMLAEVTGMVDTSLVRPVRRTLENAVRLILDAQNVPKKSSHEGGWRYQPTSRDSDLSVTGWQLLALRAAKNVGCDVPADSIDRAVAYVKTCGLENNRGFAYQPGDRTSATRTGTGILALEICGAHHTPEALGGADFLLERPLKFSDQYFYYGAYYSHIGMFKIGGRHWEKSKSHLTGLLIDNQAAEGSWTADDGSERAAGRNYCTSMAVLALAVEYRYLPIYQR